MGRAVSPLACRLTRYEREMTLAYVAQSGLTTSSFIKVALYAYIATQPPVNVTVNNTRGVNAPLPVFPHAKPMRADTGRSEPIATLQAIDVKRREGGEAFQD